ncbi:MAG: hypothetical protein EBZ48_06605 [Proteobacteria bacterium]|nr:hypothetical protein [Pseudomonadota bacterium]
MQELCNKLINMLGLQVSSNGIKRVLKSEQDYSYSTMDIESVSFETEDGLRVALTITYPKGYKYNDIKLVPSTVEDCPF